MAKYKKVLEDITKDINDIYKRTDTTKSQWARRQEAIGIYSKKLSFLERLANTQKEKTNFQLMAFSVDSYVNELNGKLEHYYVKQDVCDFLNMQSIKSFNIDDCFIKHLAIHTPDNAFVISLSNVDNVATFVINSKTLDESGYIRIETNGTGDIAFDEKELQKYGSYTKYIKFFVNLMFYAKWKPECVIEGLPDDMVKNDRKASTGQKARMIKLTGDISKYCSKDSTGRTVMPHAVSGFFRTYRDERYVNMKGQVQWIAPFMKKGHAMTVIK